LRSGYAPMSHDAESTPRQFVELVTADEVAEIALSDGKASAPGPSSETVTKWLSAVAQLHRSSASSAEFFNDAARFAIHTVGLDSAWVLSYCATQQEWQVVGTASREPNDQSPDPQVLASLIRDRTTRYEPSVGAAENQRTHAVTIAPVLAADGELLGTVYGIRNTDGENRRRGIRPLEARMIQLLAESVAVGIARLAQETAAARTRVLLEQAFSPAVAESIERNPDCLAGQLREVTLLFADLRGFTTLAETLPPVDCYRLLGEVMEALTQVVIQQEGIVVDYYGDGLLALWNAPLDQPNHADLACQTALAMLDALPEVSRDWRHLLGGPLELGIGVHSGPVLVGNAGTQSRLKYGPRGSNVNLASRVQAATRQLEASLLVTAATQRQLSNKFFTMRTCTARLPGLEQPVELFTVYPSCEASKVKSRLEQYAHALKLFENGELAEAEMLLTELVAAGPATPARFLAQQAFNQRQAEVGRRASDRSTIEQGAIVEIHEK
jgi:adenylate cyclase